jgi:hypothetical protein
MAAVAAAEATAATAVAAATEAAVATKGVCVDLVSRGRGPFVERPDYRVPRLVPPPP